MTSKFQKKERFDRDELRALAQGRLPEATFAPRLPTALLLPFHEIPVIRWDQESGGGRVEAVRYNRPDDWYYARKA